MTREEAKLVLRSWGVPKGREYEAIMTLIPELKESADERIRKEIISALKFANDGGVYDRHIAYLEKQKEQEPNIELIQRSWYMEGFHDCEFGYEPKWIIKTGEGGPRYEENPKYGQHFEQKPAEWSKEDEEHRQWILECLADGKRKVPEFAEQYQAAFAWLKSIRPSWKPSEEQIRLLQYLSKGIDVASHERHILDDMIDDLKRLM